MELEPLTPLEIESEIQRITADIEAETRTFGDLAKAAAEAEVKHKVEHAQALLRAEGTEKAREAQATQVAAESYMGRRVAEARERASKELLTSLRARLDAFRTLAANVRTLT